ncbi:MAG: discoidin domain-containing protein, partial [Kiritimatiellae bacterium]|nr:discoidin domain-containing protein [Kiritimatiellia bacterium]
IILAVVFAGSALAARCEVTEMAERPFSIPPKTEWKATASANQKPDAFFPSEAIDGDGATRWSSPNSQPNWFEIDLGRLADLYGCTIHWETAFASAYDIETSADGLSWEKVYTTQDGDGKTDELFFRPVRARFLRIHATERGTSHWGFSIFEVDIKGVDEQPLVKVEGQNGKEAMRAFDGSFDTVWKGPESAPYALDIDLRGEKNLGGIWIKWGENFATRATLFTSTDGKTWEQVARISDGTGGKDILLHKGRKARAIRLRIDETRGNLPVEIQDISLCSPGEHENSLLKYNFVAKKHRRGIYPLQFLNEQVYWTLVGTPGDSDEALLDEYGNFEPRQKAGSLQPYLQVGDEIVCAPDAPVLEHSMEGGYLPMPCVGWHTTPISLRIRAMARGKDPDSACYVSYTLKNVTDQPQKGRFFLVVRPVQINPSWQFGGVSPIESLEYKDLSEGLGVFVNDTLQYASLTPPSATAIRAFEQGDIIEDLLRGRFPRSDGLKNAGKELSGALAYEMDLAPGEEQCVIIAAPVHESRADIREFAREIGGDPSQAKNVFEKVYSEVALQWRDLLDRVTIEIPEQRMISIMKAQLAYIMINRDGPAIQPGSRNYKRAFMRDGCLTSGALLRMGCTNEVRDYLDWYSQRVDKEGWVPPILNNDGSINQGFGWDNEYDSQGEYLFAMMQYYQFTKDRSLIIKYFDAIYGAMKYLVALREKTLAPGYMANEEAPERFVGVLPRSISHEGYNPPVHSYWDMFFALKGLKDGAVAAHLAGRDEVAVWAKKQYHLFRKSMQESMKSTVDWKGVDYVPACAEYADCDPTSTAIAFFPCGEQEIMSEERMRRTYEIYYNSFRQRLRPGWHGYTPYEVRVIPALVELGHKDQAKQVLDTILRDCRPRGWKHLPEVVVSDARKGSYMGDMPHTWIGSAIVNSVRFMIVHEDGNKLVLLKGIPDNWVEGEGLRVANLPTHFGTLDMSARMQDGTLGVLLGGSIKVRGGFDLCWPAADKPTQVWVDGREWNAFDDAGVHVPTGTRTIKARWSTEPDETT